MRRTRRRPHGVAASWAARAVIVCLAAAVGCAVAVLFTAPSPAASTPMAASEPATARAAASPPARWITVSVATLWVKPGLARAVDAPAGAVPADPRAWVAAMSVSQKRWLVGRLETQALYGTRVSLLATSGGWSRVAVAGQPTPRLSRGYPGWLPTAQVGKTAPATTQSIAVVKRPTAWAWDGPIWQRQLLELSYGTRLPAVAWTSDSVEVVLLDGRHAFLKRSAVARHLAGAPWRALTGARIVAEARRFLGLHYLWAGASGFGFDCSGFTHAVFRALGTTLPRDAGPQSARGRKVASRASLRPGDLVFFRNSGGSIHHVGIYAGGGRMIHAPATGQAVRLTPLSASPYAAEFAGGRRFTP